MQKPEEPFPLTQELRQLAVDTLAGIIETGTTAEQIEACRVLVEMDAINIQASEGTSWLGKPSNN